MTVDIDHENIDEYINARIQETAHLLGYDDFNIKTDKADGTIIGNLGVIKKFYIDGMLDGERKNTYLIAKTITTNKTKRRCVPVETYAAREAHMYSSIFKLFDQMQEEYGVPAKFPHLKVYSVNSDKNKELILMENLGIKGYEFPKNFKALDFDHSLLFLQALGQFHALSFAFKHRNPGIFKLLVKDLHELHISSSVCCYIEHMFKSAYRYGFDNVPEIKKYVQVLGKEDAFRTSENFFAKPDQNGIICHGDPWSANGLYMYKDNKPEKFMLLDWQCIRHTSPIVDLLYFLFTSVEEGLRENRLKELIEIYYQVLETSLLDLKCDARDLYPKSTFHRELKEHSSAAVGDCLIMIILFFLEPSVIGYMENEPEDVAFDLPPMTDIVRNKYRQMAVDYNRIQTFFE